MFWKTDWARMACAALLVAAAACAVSCGSSNNGNNNGTLCPGGSADLSPWFGLWLLTDSTYDCAGHLQDVSTDSLVLCYRSSPTNIGSSALGDSSLICTATICSATTVTATCSGQLANAGCTANYAISYTAVRNGENVHSSASLSTNYVGNCGGLPGVCEKIGSSWHRATTDTSLFGKLGGNGGGGGGGNTLSMKVNGVTWSATDVSVLIKPRASGSLSIQASNSLLPASSFSVALSYSAALTPRTYSVGETQVILGMVYDTGPATYTSLGANDVFTLATIDTTGHRITGAFHFTGIPYMGGSNVLISEGTFDLSYSPVGLSPWSYRIWKAIYEPRRRG